jgi:hypothetical protein
VLGNELQTDTREQVLIKKTLGLLKTCVMFACQEPSSM